MKEIYYCAFCGIKRGTIALVKKHQRTIHGERGTVGAVIWSKKKTRNCVHCGQKFSTVVAFSSFLSHSITCYRNRFRKWPVAHDYRCVLCGKRFLRHANLIVHMKRAHEAQKEPPRNALPADELVFKAYSLLHDTLPAEELLEIDYIEEDKVRRLKAEGTRIKYRFSPLSRALALEAGLFVQVLTKVFGYLIAEKNLRSNKLVQISLQSENSLDYPIQTGFTFGDKFMLDSFLSLVENAMQSQKSLGIDQEMELSITTLNREHRMVRGGMSKSQLQPGHHADQREVLLRKRGFLNTARLKTETNCFILSVAIGVCYIDTLTKVKRMNWWKKARKSPVKVEKVVNTLSAILNLGGHQFIMSTENFNKVQLWLRAKYSINLIVLELKSDFLKNPSILYDSLSAGKQMLVGVARKHAFLITNQKLAFNGKEICVFCKNLVKLKKHKRCANQDLPCLYCNDRFCERVYQWRKNMWLKRSCEICSCRFKNDLCLLQHTLNGTCEKYRACKRCNRRMAIGKLSKHNCSVFYCSRCHTHDDNGNTHKCFMKVQETKKRCLTKFIPFDLETRTRKDNVLVVNCAVAISLCSDCIEDYDTKASCINCGSNRVHAFVGETSLIEFTRWLFFDQKNADAYSFAHYGSGFDNHFLWTSLINDFHCYPDQLIIKGQKLLAFRAGRNIRIRDSFQWFRSGLRRLPAMWSLDVKKTFFPFNFGSSDKLNYVGRWPDKCDFHVDEQDRADFEVWYSESRAERPIWNTRCELISYCLRDTIVLWQSCAKYRALMLELEGICPLSQTLSQADATGKIFQTNYLPPETVALVGDKDIVGRCRAEQSHEALQFLSYLKKTTIPDLEYAGNGSEIRIANSHMRIDGFSEKEGIFEYLGCQMHGCPHETKHHRKLTGPHPLFLGKSYEMIFEQTWSRLEKLQRANIGPVHYLWSCQLKDILCGDKNMRQHFENTSKDEIFDHPIMPRQGMFGGRTDASVVLMEISDEEYAEGWRATYVDVCSLYTWVMCASHEHQFDFPIGHAKLMYGFELPEEHQKCFDLKALSCYNGLVRANVIAPTSLIHGCLPYRLHGTERLTFPICVKCAERADHELLCSHNDEERAFTGVWSSIELALALQNGYVVRRVHSLWHVANRSKTIFNNFMRKYQRLQHMSNGWPEEYVERKQEYLDQLWRREGIELKVEDICRNEALRTFCKGLKNALWGKIGQRQSDKLKYYFVRSMDELDELLDDPKYVFNNLRFLGNEKEALVELNDDEMWCGPHGIQNTLLALWVTSIARIRLYGFMKALGRHHMYNDTDSLLYYYKLDADGRRPSWCPEEGPFLGMLKPVFESGDSVRKFCSLGPKNFLLVTHHGKCHFTCKGLRLNSELREKISFELIRDVLLGREEGVAKFYAKLGDEEAAQRCAALAVRGHLVIPQPQILHPWKKGLPVQLDPDRTKTIRLTVSKRQLFRDPNDDPVVKIRSLEWGFLRCTPTERTRSAGCSSLPTEGDRATRCAWRRSPKVGARV